MNIQKLNNACAVSFKAKSKTSNETKNSRSRAAEPTPYEPVSYPLFISNLYYPWMHAEGNSLKPRFIKDKKTGLKLQENSFGEGVKDYFYTADGTLKYKMQDSGDDGYDKQITAFKADGKSLAFEMTLDRKSNQSVIFFDENGEQEGVLSNESGVTYKDKNGVFKSEKENGEHGEKLSFTSHNGIFEFVREEGIPDAESETGRFVEYKIKNYKNGRKRECKVVHNLDDHTFAVADKFHGNAVYNAKKGAVEEGSTIPTKKLNSILNSLEVIDEKLFNKEDEVLEKLEKVQNAKDDLRKMDMNKTHFLNDSKDCF